VHEVDAGRPFWIVPVVDSDAARKLAHALLDSLWKDPEYRRNLHEWIAANPRAIADDQLADWLRHYHRAFADSLEFVDEDTLSVLWRLERINIIGDLPREICADSSPQAINAKLQPSRDTLLNGQWSALALSLSPALAREFKRQNAPQPGDRPIGQMMTQVTLNTIHATADKLPGRDGQLLLDAFSYGKPPSSSQEGCERNWVSSRAIQDSKVHDDRHLVSASLMRHTVIPTSVSGFFENIDRQVGVTRPQGEGFTPGKASVYTPPIAVRNGLVGTMRVSVQVDASGMPSTSIVQSALRPEKLTALDGTILPSSAVMLEVINAYYREGAFAGDARQFEVNYVWK
jgi:hypothetical protein